ncbi:MAG: TonB-dependent receptor [Paraglaciecola sp.]|uniref:TonB-dependent receptor n=1 Tax=Alishewanella sp. SMS8 TaxID=2994676 RepID=UPI0027421645|nr:TonB-dependent receptor [Alishewanella sp. SMS8]MDP5131718.1 TonB-dependent receptor [Paraglaciecola sp.]MDP5206163.1 TonB-dependent receptor [Alishewanella sp. SMS9]MDP5460788.1 TonB-dependent receptor [Alishewanella sp. SMS8]
MHKPVILIFSVCSLFSYSNSLQADPLSSHAIENILIKGRQIDLLGHSSSASEGIIGNAEILDRPLLRTGEILEFIPGMVVTQHSGSGKSNQYFLRGFNLDHGTDFSNFVDGMPVNMRSHGHGQGYTDLNFIIPEIISQIDYQKGTYLANSGDFSAAGSARFGLQNTTPNEISLTLGENAYQRVLAKGSLNTAQGNLLLASELQGYDGPWQDISENTRKVNLLSRYSQRLENGQFALTVMAYDNSWNAADQVPQRAINDGLIGRFGSLDNTLGGDSSRYSLSGSWFNDNWQANAYIIRSELDLWSNFTYFLADPVNGDQFEQTDSRTIYGGEISRNWHRDIGSIAAEYVVGVQTRIDDIAEVGLYNTQARQRLNTVREDAVLQRSIGLFNQNTFALTEQWLLHIGARYDVMRARVDSNEEANSGKSSEGIVSFKGGLSYQMSPNWQSYFNVGQGFHSNDARGTTATRVPQTDEAVEPVDFLVRSNGAELGIRYFDSVTFNASAALWYLDMDSELLYVGDAGTNEPSRASRRYGLEIAAYYWLNNSWSIDTELALTRSRFTEEATDEGEYIDGSLPMVFSMGLIYKADDVWQTSLRLRHFGKRTLDSFNEQRSASSTVLNGNLKYNLSNWRVSIDLLNILNSKASDIEYFYASRLNNEAAEGIEDRHIHPMEPRTVRISATYAF